MQSTPQFYHQQQCSCENIIKDKKDAHQGYFTMEQEQTNGTRQ